MKVSTARPIPPDDDLLVAYLLGSLSQDDTERLDELSVTDDEVAARLATIENDLIDQYVGGQLSAETLERFRAQYLASPRRREKVRFAETLAAYHRTGRAVVTTPLPETSRAALPRWRGPWQLAAAAAVVFAIGAATLMRTVRDRSADSAPRAVTVNPQTAAPTQNAPPNAPATATAPAPPDRPAAEPPRPAPIVAAFILAAPTRGAESAEIELPRAAERVTLTLMLEDDSFSRYDISINEAASGRSMWKTSGVRSTSSNGSHAVVVTLPANMLSSQRYVIDLTGVSAGREPEPIGQYPLRVVIIGSR